MHEGITRDTVSGWLRLPAAGVPRDPDGPPSHLSGGDVALLGLAAYADYYQYQAALAKDPAPLANYLLGLARGLAKAYARQSIKGGTAGFQFAVSQAFRVLARGMGTLGLFPLDEV